MSDETCQLGTYFKALNETAIMALSKILGNFLPFRVFQWQVLMTVIRLSGSGLDTRWRCFLLDWYWGQNKLSIWVQNSSNQTLRLGVRVYPKFQSPKTGHLFCQTKCQVVVAKFSGRPAPRLSLTGANKLFCHRKTGKRPCHGWSIYPPTQRGLFLNLAGLFKMQL